MVSGNSEAKEMDMSKYMQLKVTVSPAYSGDLEKVYPKLARHMGYLDADLVRRSPSLFELAGQLDQLLYRFEGTQLRTVLLQHGEKLRMLHKGIVERIANWNLAEADRMLYEMEDLFEDIESALD
jgi:hypothetical protein